MTELVCHRCGALLTPGDGTFYVVRIDAIADPTPPALDLDASTDVTADISVLIEEMSDRSERELVDDVYRRVTIHLCRACYQSWIEDPAGQGPK